jgi:hypothetical protein
VPFRRTEGDVKADRVDLRDPGQRPPETVSRRMTDRRIKDIDGRIGAKPREPGAEGGFWRLAANLQSGPHVR